MEAFLFQHKLIHFDLETLFEEELVWRAKVRSGADLLFIHL